MSVTHDSKLQSISLPVKGMSCASCASRIEKKVGELKGVEKASVNFGAEVAAVDYDPEKISPADVSRTIEKLGFQIPRTKEVFRVEGMSCASCVSRIEGQLTGMEGVATVRVNLATEKAVVEYLPSVTGFENFQSALKDIGYTLLPAEQEDGQEDKEEDRHAKELFQLKIKFLTSAILGAVIMLGGMQETLPVLPKIGRAHV